jgi:hypothetical protein
MIDDRRMTNLKPETWNLELETSNLKPQTSNYSYRIVFTGEIRAMR